MRPGGDAATESSAVRAHVPAAFWFFANGWNDLFRNGICDHAIKELCRVYISRTVKCEYRGNQRSEKGQQLGLVEGQYDELLKFREFVHVYGPPEGGARLRRGDRVAARHRRRVLGAPAPSLHRAGTRRAGLCHRTHAGAAELAPPAEHRAPPDHGGDHRLDGPRLRDARGAQREQGVARLLGAQLTAAPATRNTRPA